MSGSEDVGLKSSPEITDSDPVVSRYPLTEVTVRMHDILTSTCSLDIDSLIFPSDLDDNVMAIDASPISDDGGIHVRAWEHQMAEDWITHNSACIHPSDLR